MNDLKVYGKLVQGATEDVSGWRCIREVDVPASGTKTAFYGECVAMVIDDRPLAYAMAAAPVLLKAVQVAFEWSCVRSKGRTKWTQEDQHVHELLKDALTASVVREG